jgi:hypothetical protein
MHDGQLGSVVQILKTKARAVCISDLFDPEGKKLGEEARGLRMMSGAAAHSALTAAADEIQEQMGKLGLENGGKVAVAPNKNETLQ